MDLSHWLTDADACARLGLSARSLDREAKAGRLHPMNRPVEGRRPERVWNPEEIQARMPKMPDVDELSIAAEKLASALEIRLSETQFPTLFLTLHQASQYTGLSVALLRRLIRMSILPSLRDRSIKVCRAHLDAIVKSPHLVRVTAEYGAAATVLIAWIRSEPPGSLDATAWRDVAQEMATLRGKFAKTEKLQ